jgi:creatinine amidohydrolase/Fe(II)-dependent formamide hydrolase-like protein
MRKLIRAFSADLQNQRRKMLSVTEGFYFFPVILYGYETKFLAFTGRALVVTKSMENYRKREKKKKTGHLN